MRYLRARTPDAKTVTGRQVANGSAINVYQCFGDGPFRLIREISVRWLVER
jgi:hypothetical protein